MRENPDQFSVLLQQIAEGHEKAFRVLFDSYHKKLFHYIVGITKSNQVAEELVMDVFMKIWQGREMVNQIENFNAFLFRVAYNKSIDFLRSASKDPQLKDLLCDQIQLTASDSSSDRNILMHEFEAKVREAIQLLTPQRKRVYELSRQQEMNHDQIASHLQISKNTVNNHIVQAEYFIRSYLSKNMDLTTLVFFVVYSPAIS